MSRTGATSSTRMRATWTSLLFVCLFLFVSVVPHVRGWDGLRHGDRSLHQSTIKSIADTSDDELMAEIESQSSIVAEASEDSPSRDNDAVEDDTASSLMEVRSMSRSTSRSTSTARARTHWAHPHPRHRHSSRHSIKADRMRAANTARENANYARNLAKMNNAINVKANAKMSRPSNADMRRVNQHKRVAGGKLHHSVEEENVQSMIQTSSTPIVVRHINDIHAALTHDTLHGTGLSNESNRQRAQAALAADVSSHPLAPMFHSLVEVDQHSSAATTMSPARGEFDGPIVASLPSLNVAPPRVLQAGSIAAKSSSSSAAQSSSPESSPQSSSESFLSGLPDAFMELDAQTQMDILSIVDAHSNDAAVASSSSPSAAADTVLLSSSSHASSSSIAAAAAPSLTDSEFASFSSRLRTLELLQHESHMPMAALIKMMAKDK